MGTMSASDAAPLPRLGEVFFDVRGNSRSMRLSWYADTGVAVLSIWQGGMCTGTFRLAIGDLPRLVETLQRGPAGHQPGWESGAPGQPMPDPLMEPTARAQSMGPLPGQGQPDLPPEPVDYLTGAGEYPEHRAGPPGYLAEPPDHRAMPREYRAEPPEYGAEPPEYRAEPPEYRAEPPEYRAEPPDDLRTGPAQYPAGSPDYPAGPPDQAGTREYLAPPPDRQAGPPDRRARPPDHRAGPAEYGAASPDYPAGPPDRRAGPAEYPAGPPDHRAGPAEYGAGSPDYPAGPPDRRAGPPDHRAGPAEYPGGPPNHRAGPPEYPGGPPDHRAGSPAYGAGPAEYQSGPPGHRAGPPEYPGGPPDYWAGPPDHRAVPPRPRTEYPADLPPAAGGADPAGDGSAIYVGSRRPEASDPGTRETAAYPRDTGGQVSYQREPAGDLYRGTGPLDYPGEPSMPHYPPGTSAPARSDALGRSPADYPAHYSAAVTDDFGQEPRQDSFHYGRSAGGHGAPSRHADPDA
jgi:hypothetical protein